MLSASAMFKTGSSTSLCMLAKTLWDSNRAYFASRYFVTSLGFLAWRSRQCIGGRRGACDPNRAASSKSRKKAR
jgi:hypothetical protein